MKTASISNILKCMNPQCTRVIVTRGARRWAGPEVPSEQIHKLYNPSSLPVLGGLRMRPLHDQRDGRRSSSPHRFT